MRTTSPDTECVVYKGIVFRRYPKSKRRQLRVYFYPSANYIRKGVGALHREIWKDANGPIPDGSHIHHKDGNPSNNAIENLECISPMQHIHEHLTDERRERMREIADTYRHLTKAWHASEEGRKWHSEHAKAIIRKTGTHSFVRRMRSLICEQCGKTYETSKYSNSKFCSNKCKSAWRRKEKLDFIEKTCPACTSIFSSNKYNGIICCSHACAAKMRSRDRASLQSNG